MPDVEVVYATDARVDFFRLADTLGGMVVSELPLEGRALEKGEVDIEFRERGPYDQPLAHIRITVSAHGTPERLRRSDSIARAIRMAVEEVTEGYAVDVRVRLAEVGYSSESYDRRKMQTGLAKSALS